MSWEFRNGNRYYYHAERVGVRVVKTYVGAGEFVELALQVRRSEKLRAWLDRDDEYEEAERASKQEEKTVGLLARIIVASEEALRRAGYHQHKGQWRRRRGIIVKALKTKPSSVLTEWDDARLPSPVGGLSPQARKKDATGDVSVMPLVNKELARNPELARRWGDLAHVTLTSLLDSVKWS